MAKKQSAKFDAAGWKFWLITWVVLIVPGIFGMSRIVREKTAGFVIVFMGALAAAAAAGLVAWIVNSSIQFFRNRERKQQKKTRR